MLTQRTSLFSEAVDIEDSVESQIGKKFKQRVISGQIERDQCKTYGRKFWQKTHFIDMNLSLKCLILPTRYKCI